jgi:hypothetical protein
MFCLAFLFSSLEFYLQSSLQQYGGFTEDGLDAVWYEWEFEFSTGDGTESGAAGAQGPV